jgi:hypothetical protein
MMTPAAAATKGQTSELAVSLRHTLTLLIMGDRDKHEHKYLFQGTCAAITKVQLIQKGKNGTTSAIVALHFRMMVGHGAYHRIR